MTLWNSFNCNQFYQKNIKKAVNIKIHSVMWLRQLFHLHREWREKNNSNVMRNKKKRFSANGTHQLFRKQSNRASKQKVYLLVIEIQVVYSFWYCSVGFENIYVRGKRIFGFLRIFSIELTCIKYLTWKKATTKTNIIWESECKLLVKYSKQFKF